MSSALFTMIRPMVSKNNGVVRNAKDKFLRDIKDNNSNSSHLSMLPSSSFTNLFPNVEPSSPLVQNSPLLLRSSQTHSQIESVEDLETEIHKRFAGLVVAEFNKAAGAGHLDSRVVHTLSDLESEVCASILVG
ncbi:uncharacterized protein ASCRUDRAFT_127302 [Ascoidea rubescens DSM 1968]|uniref:Uncharacterized protein n=1 Tax=Ascoidea rubescens DSM 1968 TaxID=1344418 RepID=A0A1D2VNJ3_9ASCO|nr:hypothetical protein ASCRUDRAFT_127302 [Ascoidea rubescens DSM 1968]ODV63125.1 hypothetical protein ASCRUDRAFT_127302 [Ascoidea rubescens DSM 1968]